VCLAFLTFASSQRRASGQATDPFPRQPATTEDDGLFGATSDTTNPLAADPDRLQAMSAGMTRTRITTINLAQLGDPATNALTADLIGQAVRLNLFAEIDLVAVREKVQRNLAGGYTWIGHIDGLPLSQAVFVVRGGALYGAIQAPGVGEFAVQPLDGGYHLLQQAGPNTILPQDDTHIAIADVTEQTAKPAAPMVVAAAAAGSTADNGSLIDVLVVYSDDVNDADAQSFADLFMAYTNQAYENSNINQRVWLVDVEEFTYSETGSLSSDLSNITNNANPNVLPYRNQYHADLVVFFVSNDGSNANSCSGLAWLQTTVNLNFEDNGYSVMKACSFGSSVFAHELGHNMGSRHDWYMDSDKTPFTYAHGYVDTTRRFRTIMSYDNRCSALGFSCSAIPYFSNPNVSYNGFTTGVAGGTANNCAENNANPATECDADEHRTFNETAANTSSFRSSQLTWSGAVSTDWSNAANWTINEGAPGATTATNRVPRSFDNIFIPSGIARMPTISSGTVTAREVVIASGATLNMSGGTLTVGWRWEDSGGFNGTGGTVIFTSPLDLVITSAAGSTFNHVQVGDGVSTSALTLNSNLDINGNLTIKAGAELKAGAHTINLAGNWSDESNGFTPATSTVIFDGATQSVDKVTSNTLINQNFNTYTSCCGWNTATSIPPTGWARETVGAGSGWLLGNQTATRAGTSTDGWLYTAAVTLQPNVQYQLSYALLVLDQTPFGTITPQNLTVAYGAAQSSGAMLTTIDSATTSSTASANRSASFTVATAGTYYIGFRATQSTTGDWFILDNIQLTGVQNIILYNAQVAAGMTSFNQSVVLQNNLTVNANATANLGTNSMTVEGTVTNNGTLQQRKSVASGVTTEFLRIKNAAGASDKYDGIEITPAGNLGNTTVAIRGNQNCTEGGGATTPVKRCYDITPTTVQTAQIRFYYRAAEANSNTSPQVYHYTGTGTTWEQENFVARGGSGEALWVTANNIDGYSSFRLADVSSPATATPTATATGTATALPTATGTATTAPTATGTATTAPTATGTATALPTATGTATALPTATATATALPPATGTATALPTTTGTATTAPTATGTATTAPTATGTVTTAPTTTGTATALPTATGTVTTAPTATGTATALPTTTATPTALPSVTATPPPPPTATANPSALIYISAGANGRVDGLTFRDEDILVYDPTTNGWTMVFDGSDVGVGNANLVAFYFTDGNVILMSFDRPLKLPGIETVDDSDIVRFTYTQLGATTAGSFTLFLDGSAVGLTTSGEAIDAFALDQSNRLVLSTEGTIKVASLTGQDEDLLALTLTGTGAATSGTWSFFWDGSDVGLTKGSEDLSALWIAPESGAIYFGAKGNFAATGSATTISGAANSIVTCMPLSLGDNTDCTFAPFFDGNSARFRTAIDSFGLSTAATSAAQAWVVTGEHAMPDAGALQYEVAEDGVGTPEEDAELDEYDHLAVEAELRLFYLPLITR